MGDKLVILIFCSFLLLACVFSVTHERKMVRICTAVTEGTWRRRHRRKHTRYYINYTVNSRNYTIISTNIPAKDSSGFLGLDGQCKVWFNPNNPAQATVHRLLFGDYLTAGLCIFAILSCAFSSLG